MPTLELMPGPCGAFVDGVGRDLGDVDTALFLAAALAAHRILVVREVSPTLREYARFGHHFGEPIMFFDPRSRNAELPEVIEIHNSPTTSAVLRDGAMHWHQDSSYETVPAAVTMLLAVESPVIGNETLFADLTSAYEALDEATKARIDGLVVRHDPLGGRVAFEGERRGGSRPVGTVVTEVRHPLVRRHPTTGRSALYGISGTAAGIVGLDDDEGIDLLIRLKRHALRPEFRQRATAEQGSILMWDNLSVMHCATRTEYSDEPGKRRRLHRISTRCEAAGDATAPRTDERAYT
ncbi:MAG: hypothetical protein JWL72_3104 [Ilumatobacteraceae bacterium]|nr:hypothetical protein [Ilumatobacteraceae bacterium]